MSLKSEIDAAIMAHENWKTLLSTSIDTGATHININEAKDDTICQFGRWLYGPTIPQAIKNTPLFQEINKLHSEFHQCAGVVLTLIQEGHLDQAKAMMNEGGKYANISSELLANMRQL